MGEKQKRGIALIDGLSKKNSQQKFYDLGFFQDINARADFSSLYSKKGITRSFFTRDSKLYLTPEEYRTLKSGGRLARISRRLDGLASRDYSQLEIHRNTPQDWMYLNIRRRYSKLRNYCIDLVQGSVQGVSLAKMWNLSIVGAIIFGMFTMTMVYRYLGQNVSAKMKETKAAAEEQSLSNEKQGGKYATLSQKDKEDLNDDIDTKYISKLIEDYGGKSDSELEKEIREMVKGYPIEKMAPEIAKQDRIVAAYLVAIARKESSWGKRVPVLDGQDCYNYWGYRGQRERMGTGGHTCFDSTKDAVETVAKRIAYLVSNQKRNTPDKMVVWKCGSNCAVTGGQAAADKWISDVDLYFKKLNK